MGQILALDPSFTATGWALIRDDMILACRCIRTTPNHRRRGIRVADDDAERTQYLARELHRLIGANGVKGIIAELPSAGAKGARAIACMARAAAIVQSVAAVLQVPSEWVTPAEVKKAAGGAKNASKEDVERGILARWPDAPLPDLKCEREHVCDALGAYLAAEYGTLVSVLTQKRE